MKLFLIAVAVLSFLYIVLNNTEFGRLYKTVYLIVRISPYERMVVDAPKILVLGDSTGYGTGAARSTETIAGYIGTDYPNYTIENNSKNGRTIGDLLPVTKELYGSYDLILLQIGGNDILQQRDLNVVEGELRQIIANLSANTEQLVMMSSGNVGAAAAFSGEKAARYEKLTREYRAMFLLVESETKLAYVDLFLDPAHDPFLKEPEKYLSVDGLHPSSAGYAFWYQELKPVLENILTKE